MSQHTISSRLAEIRSQLDEEEARIRSDHFAGAGGSLTVQRRTALIDRALKELVSLHAENPDLPSLVAIGGYGRGELNPHSDIDIMLLCRDEGQRERAAPLLYSFWDAGLDIGYSVRLADECVDLGRSDPKIRTSLLESRLVTGNDVLYTSFRQRMQAEVFNRRIDEYVAEKVADRAATRRKFGGSLYLREPNVKESSGGLRDLHMARWIAMTRFRVSSIVELVPQSVVTEGEIGVYLRARNFLWRVRNQIHYCSGRKNDQLTYDLQEVAARDFHFRDSLHLMAVERFMKTYFIYARTVREFSRLITDRSLPAPRRFWFGRRQQIGEFSVMGKTLLSVETDAGPARPQWVLRAFAAAHERGLSLSEGVRKRIRTCRFDQDALHAADMGHTFLGILDRMEGLGATLTLMRDLRVLGRYLPEFRAIQGLARHDYYHLYTVDEHVLSAIRSLEDLWTGRHPSLASLVRAMRGLGSRWMLILAVLLHDLGKAFRSGHEHQGRRIAAPVLERLGVRGKARDRILFLVEHHLLMSTLSQRRELSDRTVIADFAKSVGDRENLDLLYLLTYADISAVSPTAWTPWKAALLQELYVRTLSFFERPEGPDAVEVRLSSVTTRLREDAREKFAQPLVDDFLFSMPRYYLLTTSPARMLEHLEWVRRLPEEQLIIQYRDLPERGCTELSVCAYDAYGLFYRTAGTIAAQGLNIVRAKVYTGRNGIMIDAFECTGADGTRIVHREIWDTVVAELHDVLATGRRPPEDRISSFAGPRPGHVPVDVAFDNASSPTLTIIDVSARDRVGLLYRITKALYHLNLDVVSAKITTEGIRVTDSFYVSDLFGEKINDRARLEKVKRSLREALEDHSAVPERGERP